MAARDDEPSIREIAELTARLRRLSHAGLNADPAEREAFLADKDALIARIEASNRKTAEPQIPAEMPAEMVAGMEERRTKPAEADDPADLQARLDDLRQRIATRDRIDGGADADARTDAAWTGEPPDDARAAIDDDGEEWSR